MEIRCGPIRGHSERQVRSTGVRSDSGRDHRSVRTGRLQFRESNMHGNPWYRLLRHEVESLVRDKSGPDSLHKKKLQKELADLNKEAGTLTTRLKAIERRRT